VDGKDHIMTYGILSCPIKPGYHQSGLSSEQAKIVMLIRDICKALYQGYDHGRRSGKYISKSNKQGSLWFMP
jgi:hypothetical protein